MANLREKRAGYNIYSSLLCQIVTLVCGLVLPRVLISSYGSEAYGACSSITQFLSYIALLEGGIGGVARAALYKPLAENNIQKISAITDEIKKFFTRLSVIFSCYILIIAICFKSISHIQVFDWLSTFLLVIVISISTLAQYYIGISYSIVLQAAQKSYINQLVMIIATIINASITVALALLGCNLIIVKLVSSCIFALRPIVLSIVAKKQFKFVDDYDHSTIYLKQKWEGLGQHIAYYLYSNTDIVLLTLFSSLKEVTVYSLYYMVTYQMQNLIASFSNGMEALFGDMLARNESKQLEGAFRFYNTLLGIVAIAMFSSCAALIVPFIKVYTLGLSDTNYIRPLFGVILTLVSLVYCVRLPYHCIIYAAGHFKETRVAAYGEAILNIVLSLALITKYGIVGIAIGTLVAAIFRFVYYVIYLSHNIMDFRMIESVKRFLVNTGNFAVVLIFGMFVDTFVFSNTLLSWLSIAAITTVFSVAICTLSNYIFYHNETKQLFAKIISGINRKWKK